MLVFVTCKQLRCHVLGAFFSVRPDFPMLRKTTFSVKVFLYRITPTDKIFKLLYLKFTDFNINGCRYKMPPRWPCWASWFGFVLLFLLKTSLSRCLQNSNFTFNYYEKISVSAYLEAYSNLDPFIVRQEHLKLCKKLLLQF